MRDMEAALRREEEHLDAVRQTRTLLATKRETVA